MHSLNELTDEEWKSLDKRLADIQIQARDVMREVGKLRQDICRHKYEEVDEDVYACIYCGKPGEVVFEADIEIRKKVV